MTKRILSVLLALVLVLGLSTVALAAESTITINKAVNGQTYTAYKMFEITAGEGDAVAYKLVDEKWDGFFAGEGADYVTIDAKDYVTWTGAKDEKTYAEFAEKALAWAKENGVAGTSATAAEGVATIPVGTGYYVVDSSVGALVIMDTNKGTATLEEKNQEPTPDKTIVNSNVDVDENNVNVGDKIEYQVVITEGKGTAELKLVDTMTDGLTFNNDVKVVIGDEEKVAGTDFVVTSPATGCTFEVEFKDTVLPLDGVTPITVTYSATLNKDAVADQEYVNKVTLKYGNDYSIETLPDETTTKTFDFDVYKVDGEDKTKKLGGAEFTLTDKDGTVLKFTSSGNVYTYDKNGTETLVTDDTDGMFTVKGLKAGTYTLTETKAPAGYNLLLNPITVEINNDGKVVIDEDQVDGITVENNAGTVLPSTGGIGTTLFYVIGGLLMAFAVVLLVAKKRTVNE